MCNHRRSSIIDSSDSTADDDSLPSLVSNYSDDSSIISDNSDDESQYPVSSDLNNSNNRSNNNNNRFTTPTITETINDMKRNYVNRRNNYVYVASQDLERNTNNSNQQINVQLERDRIRRLFDCQCCPVSKVQSIS